MASFNDLQNAVLAGNADAARRATEDLLASGADPEELINTGMIPAMDEVGRRYDAGEYYIPELLIAARAMKKSLELIRPLLAQKGAEPAGKVVIGTVAGDQHDIGKNLVGSMLEGAGFGIIDLGTDVTAEKFVQAVKESGATIVAMSSLLTTTMPAMRNVMAALEKSGLRGRVDVMVGGAPLTQRVADEIGANGYGSNANAAVQVARRFLSARKARGA